MRVPSEKISLALGASVFLGICIALAVISIVFAPDFFRPKTTIETYFKDSINGLSVGSPVKFRGVTIGEVTSIGLSSNIYPKEHINLFSKEDSLAVVRMRIYMEGRELAKEASHLIKKGLRIQTQLAGLTGTIYLEMDFLNPRQYPDNPIPISWVPHYLYIPSATSLTNEIIDNIENFLSALHSIDLPENDGGPDFLQRVSQTVISLNKTVSNIDAAKIKQILGSMEEGINSANTALKETNVVQINQLLSQLTETAKGLSNLTGDQKAVQLIQQLNRLTTSFNQMTQSNRYNLRSLLLNLAQVTSYIADLSQTLSSEPSSLFAPAATSNQPLK